MKTTTALFSVALLLFLVVDGFSQPANFGTSLHKTRAGKYFWYSAVNGGFEGLTGVPNTHPNLECEGCHGTTNADGVAYTGTYDPSCVDCHPTNSFFNPDSIKESQCRGCHTRQSTEITMGYSDVHRTAGMKCWDCHGTQDMHGDGTSYNSMLQPGAIKTDCSDAGCHPTLPAGHAAYDPHNGALHCSSCHAKTAITCYNCHFDSQVEHHLKRARAQLKDFVFLVNRVKDGKVGVGSMQSLTYQANKSFVAIGVYSAHTIVKTGARTCTDCHANFGGTIPAITEFNNTGKIKFVTFNPADSTVTNLKGVIPIPNNYMQTFKMDFITYLGNTGDPVAPSKNWGLIGEDTPDGSNMMYTNPLTASQMTKLGMVPTSIEEFNTSQFEFKLEQNYPNPFNPTTTISFSLPNDGEVTLHVFDSNGKLVQTLVNGKMNTGLYTFNFDGSKLASGVYFARLSSGKYISTQKMVLLK
ncbi:MAG: T9SS type A sorting domain-containing protein [Ignavibacteriales bacterium]|nr:T9SS type A sorting domain-containing protein [Ignavibacteriales bacterium]